MTLRIGFNKIIYMSKEEKLDKLKLYLKNLNSAAVAYSGGVDSTFLLKAAKIVLKDSVTALTACSSLFTKR